MGAVPKWQEPLAVRADKAEKTLTAVMFAPGGGAGAMAAAAAADQDLAELCREVAARTASPLLKQLLMHGARALAANAGVLLASTVDPDDLVAPAAPVDVDEDQAESLVDQVAAPDDGQALVEPTPEPVGTSDDAPTNELKTESAQASLDEEAQAVYDLVFPSEPEHWEIGLDEVADRIEQVRTDTAHWRLRDDSNVAYARQSALDAIAGIDRCLQRLHKLRDDLQAELASFDAARADPAEIGGAP